MPFTIVQNDITKIHTDIIVNATNSQLLPRGDVCGAIFRAAGYEKLRKACAKIKHCDTGKAVITSGFKLCKHIVHAVSPVYKDGKHNESKLLYSCYKASLDLAKSVEAKSIAFPLISTGFYGYPKREALSIAAKAITDFLSDNDMDVVLVIYDKHFFEIDRKRFSDLKKCIEENLDEVKIIIDEKASVVCVAEVDIKKLTQKLFGEMESSFSEYLFQLIDSKKMSDIEVYKKANIDRKLFSKIKRPRYKTSKPTAVALAIALELDMEETRILVEKAGYSITHSNEFDIIIEYFITHKIYDITEINEALFKFDQPQLGTGKYDS